MILNGAFLANEANRRSDGLWDILGAGWEFYYPAALEEPTSLPLVLLLHLPSGGVSSAVLHVDWRSPSGAAMPDQVRDELTMSSDAARQSVAPVSINVTFWQYGVHAITVSLDGISPIYLPLEVRPREQ